LGDAPEAPLTLLEKKYIGSSTQCQTGSPAEQPWRNPPVAEQSAHTNHHQRGEHHSPDRPLQSALVDEQTEPGRKAVVPQECVEGGNATKRDLSQHAELIVDGQPSLSIQRGQPRVNLLIHLRRFGKEREHREGGDQDDEEDTENRHD